MKRVLVPLLLGLFGLVLSTTARTEHPNVVLILADDLGYGDVSFNGCPDYSTPNIDSIANNGASCRNGYVTHLGSVTSNNATLTVNCATPPSIIEEFYFMHI